MGKDASRILLRAKRRKCRDDSESDGRHGDELKEAREHRRNEIKQFIQRPDVQPAKPGADNEREKPQDKLLALSVLAALCDRRLCRLLDGRMILFFRHDTPSFCMAGSLPPRRRTNHRFLRSRRLIIHIKSVWFILYESPPALSRGTTRNLTKSSKAQKRRAIIRSFFRSV